MLRGTDGFSDIQKKWLRIVQMTFLIVLPVANFKSTEEEKEKFTKKLKIWFPEIRGKNFNQRHN